VVFNILWIEDDANMIMGLVKPLIKEGFQIQTALNCKNALEYLAKKKFDLIILDIILPSGKELKSEEDLQNIDRFYGIKLLELLPSDSPPVLVLSVVSDEKTIEKISNCPYVKKYLIKGIIKPSVLKQVVHKLLNIESR